MENTKPLLPANVTASLMILSVTGYGEEKSKKISRGRLSRKSLLKLSGRKQLKEAFLDEVRGHAADLGWTIINVDEGFGILETATARGWTQVSARFAQTHREQFLAGDITEDDLANEILSDEDDEDDE